MGIRNIRKELQGIRRRMECEINPIKKREMLLEYEAVLETM